MKRRNELTCALSGLVGAISLCAYSAEFQNARLVNDGFENGLAGWGSPSKEWSVAPGQGREKSSALVWTADKAGPVPMQRLAIQGGMKYRFGAYVRAVPYDPKAVVSNVAGSVALYPDCFRRFVRVTDWPIEECVKATGYNQLRSMGITDRGEVAVGQVADMVLVDDNFVPQKTIVGGIVKFEKE